MSEQQLIENPVLVDYKRVARHFYLAIPLYILVPVGYALGFRYAGTPVHWASFGIGTAGWMIALMLRGPIALLLKKTSKERAATIIGAAHPGRLKRESDSQSCCLQDCHFNPLRLSVKGGRL